MSYKPPRSLNKPKRNGPKTAVQVALLTAISGEPFVSCCLFCSDRRTQQCEGL